MAILNDKFDEKLKDLGKEKTGLRSEIVKLQKEIHRAVAEAEEARELSGKYSANATRMERHLKKQLDKDEESYMEFFL